jgi:hypothetical protein
MANTAPIMAPLHLVVANSEVVIEHNGQSPPIPGKSLVSKNGKKGKTSHLPVPMRTRQKIMMPIRLMDGESEVND